MTNLYDETIKQAVRNRRITPEQYTHLYTCKESIGNCKVCNKLIPYVYSGGLKN